MVCGQRPQQTAHCKVPQITSTDAAIEAANDLINALSNPSPSLPNLNLDNNHYNALKQLAELFNKTTKNQRENTRLHHWPELQQNTKIISTPKPSANNQHVPTNNIIEFEPDDIDYTTSNDPFQNIIREPTH